VTALTDLWAPDRWPALAAALQPWLVAQRWFGGKARAVDGLDVADAVLLDDGALLLLIVAVAYTDGRQERYQVPLVASSDGPVGLDALRLADAAGDQGACAALARASLTSDVRPTAGGAAVRGSPVGDVPDVDLSRSRVLGVEQSNSSVVLDDALIMKLFRRLEPGLNPDVEITRALTKAGFRNTPAQAGALRCEPAGSGGEPTYLTVVSAFLGGAEEGWALAVAEARRVHDGGAPGALVGEMDALGRVVARMHVVLRDVLGAEEASSAHADSWGRAMEAQARRALDLAGRRAPETSARALGARDDILERFAGLAELGDLGLLVRTHGDLHLGQVLLDPEDGWQLLDFEGEPARPLADRRQRHSPLRDVAGVLRSFDYAAASASLEPSPALLDWRDDLRHAFLDGYRTVADSQRLLPGAWQPLLAIFELDKALYELGYELENRPDWVAIPVSGIMRAITPTISS
jgi:trehalose synthase-fused probable maltokinase